MILVLLALLACDRGPEADPDHDPFDDDHCSAPQASAILPSAALSSDGSLLATTEGGIQVVIRGVEDDQEVARFTAEWGYGLGFAGSDSLVVGGREAQVASAPDWTPRPAGRSLQVVGSLGQGVVVMGHGAPHRGTEHWVGLYHPGSEELAWLEPLEGGIVSMSAPHRVMVRVDQGAVLLSHDALLERLDGETGGAAGLRPLEHRAADVLWDQVAAYEADVLQLIRLEDGYGIVRVERCLRGATLSVHREDAVELEVSLPRPSGRAPLHPGQPWLLWPLRDGSEGRGYVDLRTGEWVGER